MSESPAERVARKEKQAREAPVNMARYRQEQQATLDKTARLRAQRLALPEMKNSVPSRKKPTSHRSLPGLHQGVRDRSTIKTSLS
jgi:hypothetical protein